MADPVNLVSEASKPVDLVSEASKPVDLCPGPVNPIDFLPEMVETKTGEEEEEVLFEQRAKCYRYFSFMSPVSLVFHTKVT